MSASEDRIKLRIDLRSGIIELDAPPGDFDHAVLKTKELAASFQFGEKTMMTSPSPKVETSVDALVSSTNGTVAGKSREKMRSAGAKSSVGRPGRLGSFDPIRELLTEDQHKQLHAYVQQKAPTDQEDQVLVVTHKGEQLLGRQGFTYNEIYTLLWRAGVDPMPKAIDVVIQRLMQDQKMDRGDNGYFMKFIGQSRVDKDLPASPKDAA